MIVIRTIGSWKNSLGQGIELLLDQAFNLIFLIVVSETKASNSVKWLRSRQLDTTFDRILKVELRRVSFMLRTLFIQLPELMRRMKLLCV